MIIEVRRRSHVQHMTYEDFEQRIRSGDITAATEVRFEVVTGTEFRRCGELELFQALADPDQMTFRRNLQRPAVPILTALLVGIQIRIYLLSWDPIAEAWLQEGFTNWAPAILEQGEVWRLLTYGLLHVSFTHILFNVCFLAYTGYHLERAMGRANMALLYFGSVFTGGMLSMAMSPDRPSLGASGGDFGMLAGTVILGWKHWESIPPRSRKYFGWALAPYLVFSIVSGLGTDNTDNWSHLGGLIGGVILMTALDPEVLRRRRQANRWRRRIAICAILASAGAVASWGTQLIPLVPWDEQGWTVQRPTYWRRGWTFTGDRGWFSPTLQATLAVTTTVHPRPLDSDDAADNLIARIGSGSRAPEVITRESISLSGWDARRLVLRFELTGESQELVALVFSRGVYEHRVQFQSVAGAAGRYAPLMRRIADQVHVRELEELSTARKRAFTHPRSWEPAVELGDALYRSGEPNAALRSYQRALELRPEAARARVGLLRVHADYAVPGGAPAARVALTLEADEPSVIVAAADALSQDGAPTEATEALDRAWQRRPGDQLIRRARLRYGLDVSIDTTGTPATGAGSP